MEQNHKTADYISAHFGIDHKLIDLVERCEHALADRFACYRKTAELNQFQVIDAFRNNQVSTRHFTPSTGYGYSDEGRERLCSLFASVFHAEAALVSPMFMSGTHAISTAFFGMLRPGDAIYCITGTPYDTFYEVIYGQSGYGSLKEWGIECIEEPLQEGQIRLSAVRETLARHHEIKVVHIQRSRGYDTRPSFSCSSIACAVQAVRSVRKDVIIFVDNCYGEFTELSEPTQAGADVIAGSLIKNPGGGIAPTGGYIAGKKEIIAKIAHRFTAPGVGDEIGSYAQSYLPFYQGLFLAPHVVSQALMGATLIAQAMTELGYEVYPKPEDERFDITQSIVFHKEEPMTAFIRGIQKASAVDAHVVPYAWDMPGYREKVIMAAGTFVQGASIELSADAPIRPPFAAYVQGGLTYEHTKLGLLYALQEMKEYL